MKDRTAYSVQRTAYWGMMAVLVCAASLLCCNAFAGTKEDADFVFAKKAFNDGFYDLAQDRFEKFLKAYPSAPHTYEAHLFLGLSFYHRDNPVKALYEFGVVADAPAGNPFQDQAVYWAGETYLAMGDYKKALEYYDRMTEDFPSSELAAMAVYSKGWACYKLELLEDAAGYFSEVVERYPFEKAAAESLFRAGECRYLLGQYDEAETLFKSFIEKYPVSEKAAEVFYLCGEISFYNEKYADAINYFKRAVSISPSASWASVAYYRIAGSYSELDKDDLAIQEFKGCVDRYDDQFIKSASMLGMARSYEKKGLTGDAERFYDEILRRFQGSDAAAEAHYRRVRLLYDGSRYGEAEKAARDAIEKFPGSVYLDDLHYELAWALAAQEKFEEAIEEFIWLEARSKDINLISSALCKTGDILSDAKDYKGALESYDAVLDKYPDSFWADYAQCRVGDIFLLTEKYDEAVLAYQSVLSNYPDTEMKEKAMFGLGSACLKNRNYERAAAEFEKMISAFRGGKSAPEANLYLGVALYGMNRYEEAAAALKKAEKDARADRVKEMARYQIARSYDGMKKEAEAIREFLSFLKDYPKSEFTPDVWFWFGEHYRSKGKFDKSEECFSMILKSPVPDEMCQRALFGMAVTKSEEKDLAGAIARLDELLERFPGSILRPQALTKASAIKKAMKDYDGSVRYLRKALTNANNESNAQIQYEIAEALEEKGVLDEAAEEYLKVPYVYPKGAFWSVRAQFRCAQIFESLDRIEDAGRLYEKLAGMDVEESKFAKERLESFGSGGKK